MDEEKRKRGVVGLFDDGDRWSALLNGNRGAEEVCVIPNSFPD